MTASVTPINEPRTPLAYAKRYIALGWWVLPLLPGTKRPFSRLVPNGFHNATNDPEVAARWWTAEPTAGVGIALKPSGLIAVDVDPRNGGFQTLDDLQAKFGKLESDVLQLTGGGGWHIVFHASDVAGLPGTLGRGIDLKADGYIAAEPTIHPSGTPYGWEASSSPLDGCIPSTLPGWIRDQARAPVQALVFEDAPMAPTPRWLDALAALPHIDSNARETWLAVGMAIHNERPDSEGFQAWCNWSEASPKFNFADQSRVWASFRRRGISGATLNTVFAMAQKAGWRNSGSVVALAPSFVPGMLLNVEQLDAQASSLRWAVKGAIPEASIGMIFGASGAFKSFIALDYALHRAYGLPWLGRKTKQAIPVYIAAEGGAGLIRRIKAWHLKHAMDWRQCPMRVVAASISLSTQAESLKKAIQAANVAPGDVIVDTMSQTFSGDENSKQEVTEFLRNLGLHLRDEFNCTVTIVHHSGHASTERARGSSAIGFDIDFIFRVDREEGAMVCSVTNTKQKDGERLDPLSFTLERHVLGHDEDGEEISSLSASMVSHASELLEAVERSAESHGAIFLRLVREIGDEQLVRRAFDEALAATGIEKKDTRSKAFRRAMDEFTKKGVVIRGAGGCVQLVDNARNEG